MSQGKHPIHNFDRNLTINSYTVSINCLLGVKLCCVLKQNIYDIRTIKANVQYIISGIYIDSSIMYQGILASMVRKTLPIFLQRADTIGLPIQVRDFSDE